MEHPTRNQWVAFLDGRLEAAARHEMAAHLDDCQTCLEAVFSLPVPVYRALGRPVCPWLPLDPGELERQVDGFMQLSEQRRASGEPVTISAEWPCESLLLTVLSLAWVRLMRRGYTAQVLGLVYGSPSPPVRPEADFAFLAGAGLYHDVGEWRHIVPGRLAVLAMGPGTQADWVLPNPKRELSERKLQPYAEAIAAVLHSPDPIERRAALCCALGADLPPGVFPVGAAAPFTHLQDPLTDSALAWRSVNGGHWLAREILRRDPPPDLKTEVAAAITDWQRSGVEGAPAAARLSRLFESPLFR